MKTHSQIPMRKLLQDGQPVYDSPPESSLLSKILFALGITALVFIGSCEVCHAYTDEEAVRVLVGEASNQGYKGMVCVGEVIRHNRSLKGFYGLHASHSSKEHAWVWLQAKKAWKASKYSHFTGNAGHFENIHAFGTPYWVKKCVKTFTWKDHVFYKESI